MPEVVPRLRHLFTSGFGYIAYLIAQIYSMVRLLPAHHPYLNPENIGKYGIHHVIAQAANNLVINRRNIDQILIFILMLTAIALLATQIILLVGALLFGPAMATSSFVTQNPEYDIAFMLLDQVFGVGDGTNNFFDSCVSQGISCNPSAGAAAGAAFPWPFHISLHNLFRFYSLGMLLIGTIIFLYYILVIIVETATTGTPFGQRFKNLWVPIRLVVAVGLLIPLGLGYNSSQYITFTAAKFGSSLATNSWIAFNQNVSNAMTGGTGNPIGEKENLIAMPKPFDASVLAEALSIVHGCAFAHYLHHERISKNTAPANPNDIQIDYPETPAQILDYLSSDISHPKYNHHVVRAYLVKTPTAAQAAINPDQYMELLADTTYEEALGFYTGGDIVIRFGRRGDEEEANTYNDEPGQVQPTCGEIRIPITDRRSTNANNVHSIDGYLGTDGYLGSVAIQRLYFQIIRDYWLDPDKNENYIDFAGRMAMLSQNPSKQPEDSACNMGCAGGGQFSPNLDLPGNYCSASPPASGTAETRDCATQPVPADWKQNAINDLQVLINSELVQIWTDYNEGTNEFNMDSTLLDRGWGGAGIWFNKLAQVNGAFITSLFAVPDMKRYPIVMETVKKEKSKTDANPAGVDIYNPNTFEGGNKIDLSSSGVSSADLIAIIEYAIFEYWNKTDKNMATNEMARTPNALEKAMNLVFGTYGLFAMTDENANIHPLAQLVALGKGLVEAAVRNVAGATFGAAAGGLSKALDEAAGGLVDVASKLIMSTAFVGLTAGFVLFYVLPFLPFLYFYFAVASWIKTIFEAMVGAPLWALAHLRIDGDGLPGESALNGYFLIFEVFIRPVLTVAGLIAAMLLFTAQVRVLNFIWPMVTDNVGGHNSNPTIGGVAKLTFKRSTVDEFFYTILYAIIVYMLATASFKLIDKIPDNILRWMGQGVSSFGDINQDPTENLTRYAALGGLTAGQKIAGGLQEVGAGLGNTGANIIKQTTASTPRPGGT